MPLNRRSQRAFGQKHADCVDLMAPGSVGTVEFDPGNLRRVLTNLLDNGIRHAGEHTGQFTVTLALSKDDQAKRAHMDVIDAGTGVPDAMLGRLFELKETTQHGVWYPGPCVNHIHVRSFCLIVF